MFSGYQHSMRRASMTSVKDSSVENPTIAECRRTSVNLVCRGISSLARKTCFSGRACQVGGAQTCSQTAAASGMAKPGMPQWKATPSASAALLPAMHLQASRSAATDGAASSSPLVISSSSCSALLSCSRSGLIREAHRQPSLLRSLT